jgi:recombination protein RecR
VRIVPTSVETVITELGKLPGIGPRTAERLAFYLLKGGAPRAGTLARAVDGLHAGVRSCRQCRNFAENELCAVCDSPARDRGVIAVVEEPFDVVAIEKTGLYHGVYHVLGGVISPIDGIGPDQLEIASLLRRVQSDPTPDTAPALAPTPAVTEVILATNPSLEGESTAMYIRRELEPLGVKVTRLARGLPVGGDLEYADQITLGRALEGRQAF